MVPNVVGIGHSSECFWWVLRFSKKFIQGSTNLLGVYALCWGRNVTIKQALCLRSRFDLHLLKKDLTVSYIFFASSQDFQGKNILLRWDMYMERAEAFPKLPFWNEHLIRQEQVCHVVKPINF